MTCQHTIFFTHSTSIHENQHYKDNPNICYYSFFSSFSSKAEWIPTFCSSSINSPLLCICKRISHPPTNSPPMKTWGIVGQFENSLIPLKEKHEEVVG